MKLDELRYKLHATSFLLLHQSTVLREITRRVSVWWCLQQNTDGCGGWAAVACKDRLWVPYQLNWMTAMAHATQETTVNDLTALNLSKLRSTRQKNISDLSREALFTWRAIRGAGLPTVQRGTVRGSGEGLVKQLAAITGSGGSLHLP